MIHRHAFRVDLAATARTRRNFRRRRIVLKPIHPTVAMARDLAAVLVRMPDFWISAIDRILAHYDPAPITRDSLFGLGDILEQLRQEADRLVVAMTPALQEWAVRMERWHRDRWSANVLTATGVQLDTVMTQGDVAEPIEAFVQRNVALVRSVSDEARGRISDIVFRGFQARTPIAEVARDLRGAADLGRARAIRIAADQSQKLSATLDQERQIQAGLTSYVWKHSHKRNPRLVHVARDGKVFSWDEPPADGPPGTQPYCGCRAQGYIDLD
jgi:SPP1 gp7 family putative phage head morphogenesis protein